MLILECGNVSMGFWKSRVIKKSCQVTRLRLMPWDFCVTCDIQNPIHTHISLTQYFNSIYTFFMILLSFHRTHLPYGGKLSWHILITQGRVEGLSKFKITYIDVEETEETRKSDVITTTEYVKVSR